MSKLLSIYLSVSLLVCPPACLAGWLSVCLSFFLSFFFSFFLSFLSIVNCQPFSFNYCCTFPSHGVRPSNFIPWHQFGKALGICTHRCMQWMVHCTIQSVFAVWEACPLGDACCGLSSRCQGCWVCPDTTWVTMSCICGMNRNHFHERWVLQPPPVSCDKWNQPPCGRSSAIEIRPQEQQKKSLVNWILWPHQSLQ